MIMFYTEIVVLSTYLGFEQIKTKPSNQTFSACYGYSKPLSYKIVGEIHLQSLLLKRAQSLKQTCQRTLTVPKRLRDLCLFMRA